MTFQDMAVNVVNAAPQMKAFALQLTCNRADAEDLLQETSLKAMENCNKFRCGDVVAWLFTIMRRQFIDDRRHEAFRTDFFENYKPTKRAASDVSMSETRRLMGELPKPQGRALMLYGLGYGYKEISEMEDVDIGTVKSRIHVGRQRLRIMLNR